MKFYRRAKKLIQLDMGQFYHFSPVSHSFMLNGSNSNFKFMTGQPSSLQSLKKGQKLTEYNPFMERRMCIHNLSVCMVIICTL